MKEALFPSDELERMKTLQRNQILVGPIEKEPFQEPSIEISNPLKLRALEDMRILLVDDEEDLREIVQFFLKKLGISFETAENGKVALEMIKRTHFDLILSDITMPVMGGFELYENFLALDITKKTKFLFLTGGALKGHEKLESVMHKADGILSKPFNVDSLLIKLKELFPDKV